jgi:hypothetical protein
VVPWTPEIQLLGEEEGEWWNKHVVPKVPPEPGGSELDGSALRRMYPVPAPGSIKVAMPHQHPIVTALLQATADKKAADTELERLKQVIQAAMGPAQELHAPGVKFTWKVDAGRVAWKEYAQSLEKLVGLMVTGENIDMDPLEEVSTLKSLYTKAGVRTFRTNIAKGPLMLVQGEPDAETE